MGSCVRRCTVCIAPLLALGTVHARRRSSVAQEHSAVVQTHLLPMSSFLHGEVKRGAGCMTRIWSLHKTMCSCIAHIAHKICTAMLDDKRNAYLQELNLSTYSSSSSQKGMAVIWHTQIILPPYFPPNIHPIHSDIGFSQPISWKTPHTLVHSPSPVPKLFKTKCRPPQSQVFSCCLVFRWRHTAQVQTQSVAFFGHCGCIVLQSRKKGFAPRHSWPG